MQKNSYWLNEYNLNISNDNFKNTCDVLIIGAGLSGLITAYTLKDSFNNIIVVDKGIIGGATSAKTTAKITSMHNLMYQDICKIFREDKTKMYYNSQEEGKEYLKDIIIKEHINCDLEQVTNYMYAKTFEGLKKLNQEIDCLELLKIKHNVVNKVPLINGVKKAIKVNNDYIFHPIKYIKGIVDILKDNNIGLYEGYCAINFEKIDDDYLIYFANGKTIKAKYVVVATHYPIFNPNNLYFSKLYQEKNYMMAFITKKNINNIYINTDNPPRSLRYHKVNNDTIGILVGNSHKSGDKTDYFTCYNDLRKAVFEFDRNASIINFWTNQDVMSIDYMPFIGKYSKITPNMYVISAFHTWGMTNSHLAALIISDLILGKDNPYVSLYNPLRKTHIHSLKESFAIIGKAINGLIISRLTVKKELLKDVKENNGAIVKYDGKCYAVYNDNGKYIFLKPNCPHTHCFLQWNALEKSWDCKCHGSRFDIYGNVLNGPSVKPLERLDIEII